MTYQEARDFAKAYDNQLQATDPRFSLLVHLEHLDGSVLLFAGAFVLVRSPWCLVFTEHHGYHVYHDDDLSFVRQFAHVALDLPDDEG